MRVLRLVVFAVFASGCLATGSMQTASTLGRGNLVAGFEGGFWAVVVPNAALASSAGINTFNVLPTVTGLFRVGVADSVDIGIRAGSTSIELGGKFMFTDPASSFAVSIAPAVRGYYLPSISDGMGGVSANTGVFSMVLPVLFGLKLGNHELVFGARINNEGWFVRDTYANAPVGAAYVIQLGASAGFALRVADSFMMMPEISMQIPVFTSAGGISQANPGFLFVSAGMGMQFGRMKPRPKAEPVKEETEEEEDEEQPKPKRGNPPPSELPPDVAPPPPPPPMVPVQP